MVYMFIFIYANGIYFIVDTISCLKYLLELLNKPNVCFMVLAIHYNIFFESVHYTITLYVFV